MAYNLIALQEAMQAALTSDSALVGLLGTPLQLYDYVPPGALYPRIVYGDQQALALDTKTTTGLEISFTLLAYSRARGRRELRQIETAVYNALHNRALTITGTNFCQCQFVSSGQRLENDGLTYRSLLEFRVTLID